MVVINREEIMQFSVGEKVVHPHYGPGQIVGVEHRELVEGFEHYYVIESLIDESTLFIPVRKTDELGLRPVMSQAKLARVLTTLQEAPRRLSKDFKVRQERIREKLATARPAKVAEAVRDLTSRRKRSYLTKVDKRLLSQARELLAAEMAVVNGIDVIYAHQTIDRALDGDEIHKPAAAEAERAVDMATIPHRQKLIHKLLRQVEGGRETSTRSQIQGA
jgi:CarD family transcriptional regulator